MKIKDRVVVAQNSRLVGAHGEVIERARGGSGVLVALDTTPPRFPTNRLWFTLDELEPESAGAGGVCCGKAMGGQRCLHCPDRP